MIASIIEVMRSQVLSGEPNGQSEALINNMPGKSSIETKCSKCENVFETEIIEHVDLSEDGELAKSLKTGKVNRAICPRCKKVNYPERGIVINFEPESLIVVFDPSAKSSQAKEQLKKDYDTVVNFNEILAEVGKETEFRVVCELDELKHLIDTYVKSHWLSESQPLLPE
jgi:phage FluMu protein Com